MANYLKATDFAAKDALLTGDANKIVKGSEINDEFDAIQTAVNTKANISSPAFTDIPTAPTAAAGTSTTQIANTSFVTTAIAAISLSDVYPVGSIYMNASVATNPGTLLGFGTWVSFGAGRVLLGDDGGDYIAEATGGSADAVVVSHNHGGAVVSAGSHSHTTAIPKSAQPEDGGASAIGVGNIVSIANQVFSSNTVAAHAHTINSDGESGTNKNLQPYIVVYMWNRTA